jgi:hypothetical protein
MPYSLQAFAFESLLTSAKMTQMMDNDQQMKASLVGSQDDGYTWPDSGHTHNGSNSALIESLGNNTVVTGNISTTESEVTDTGGGATYSFSSGSWGFYPTISRDASADGVIAWLVNSIAASTSFTPYIYLQRVGGSGNAYARSRYIQASPPYKIGDVVWGHFLFLLRNKVSGEILGGAQAEDPPWAYIGFGKKDSPERISQTPHPFVDYYENDIPNDKEIILCNLNNIDTKKWRMDKDKIGGSIFQDMHKLKITNAQTWSKFNLPDNIPGFSDKVVIREVQWR